MTREWVAKVREFKFEVDPAEDLDTRWERWDREVMALQSEGLTVRGTGPDGDDPIRFEGPDPSNLAGPYTEVYDTVPLYPGWWGQAEVTAVHHASPDGYSPPTAEEILTALAPAVERIRRGAKVEALREAADVIDRTEAAPKFEPGWHAASAGLRARADEIEGAK